MSTGTLLDKKQHDPFKLLAFMSLCSNVRYNADLYCLEVQAGFCGDAVELDLHAEGRGFDPHKGKRCLEFFFCYNCLTVWAVMLHLEHIV